MKTLILLFCCLTPNVVMAADEYFDAALVAVSMPLDQQLEQQADTLVANETQLNHVHAENPGIMCMALLQALSARRINNPFGVRSYAALHPMRRCADTRAVRFGTDIVSILPTAYGGIGTVVYQGTGITELNSEVFP